MYCERFCRNLTFLLFRCRSSLPPASEEWGKVLFSVCLSVHTSTGGGGVPQSGLDGWGGGGVVRSGWLDGGQVLIGGGTPAQVWMGGYLPPWLDGVPPPHHHEWMGYPPLPWVDGVTPPPWVDGVPPFPPPHHSEHWLRGGRYASCVHAGGLSCFHMIFQSRLAEPSGSRFLHVLNFFKRHNHHVFSYKFLSFSVFN